MRPHLSLQQLTILTASFVFLAGIVFLGIYLLHKSIRENLKPDDVKPPRLRDEDDTAFIIATLQAVIAQLKTTGKHLGEKLAAAERRADQNARQTDMIAREIDEAMIIFDAMGFIAHASAPVREALAIDTWSRRRYPEVLASMPSVAEMVSACLETGVETSQELVEFAGRDESARKAAVAVLPVRDRVGSVEAVVCFFREAPAAETGRQ
jgi:hypothetical protein